MQSEYCRSVLYVQNKLLININYIYSLVIPNVRRNRHIQNSKQGQIFVSP